MSPRMGPILSMVGFEVVKRNWGWFLALRNCADYPGHDRTG